MNKGRQEQLRQLPAVDRLLGHERLQGPIKEFGIDLVKHAVRQAIEAARAGVRERGERPDLAAILDEVERRCRAIARPSLRAMVNATGVLIHTNLGRAPIGARLFEEIRGALQGYANLEFDLATGERGSRHEHLQALLCYLTGAEDAVVVNNNAAALVLILSTFAAGREVIVSRGELIEIGGSFRLPEILATSGARLVEVGTTNRTRLADYAAAITPQTALLLKSHTSNFAIRGFTATPTLEELSDLGRARGVPVVYDIGSGLLRRPPGWPLADEPDVRRAVAAGLDLVTFSGDKLLGGPQAGIVVGRAALVARLKQAPLMRALRVGKLIIAALASACRAWLDDERLAEAIPVLGMLRTTLAQLAVRASRLQTHLAERGVVAHLEPSSGQAGGGTLPDLQIPSWAVVIAPPAGSPAGRSAFAERLFRALLARERPILAILRQGRLALDVLTLPDDDLPAIAAEVAAAVAVARGEAA
ncbi:MAG: L-seryl-tRNA(Sec) selenium transferase [Candidatus Ozemobacter sibiricus]|uniref:L-seryl-tRNA(Sec) selenium transferase n=1 Tax=Candidatus Ozemobacter sibiricus TaxID=2268124 RepID=A0A367ZIN3_9BACT|nr:MAG: L-seryl-tRNA(Sec) selenium transferase [Candidatus Ozemobacter sibiricus]